MPELPPPRREPAVPPPAADAALPYAELHCRTNFSFLEGASHPDELAARAAERCYGLAELHRGPDDRARLAMCVATACEAGVPLAAANDVHYHVPERRPLQDVLTAVRHGCSVAELGRRRFPNAERHLQPAVEMHA